MAGENEDKKEKKKADEKIESKVDEKIEKTVEKGASKTEAVNIIGDIKPPEDPKDKDEIKAYLKKIDEKLESLLNPKPKESETPTGSQKTEPTPQVVEKAWYDREII